MRITKIGHSCLLVEEGGATILIDPGSYSTGQDDVRGIDAILITHEHQDHVSLDSLKKVLANNPGAQIFTNSAVGKMLADAGIAYTKLEDGEETKVKGVSIKGFGKEHAALHESIPVAHNVGYFVADRFFYPGDSFYIPAQPVDILAMPAAAPWMKISEGVAYATAVKPRLCFPVHDGMLREGRLGLTYALPERILPPLGITFIPLAAGGVIEDKAI